MSDFMHGFMEAMGAGVALVVVGWIVMKIWG